MSIRLLAVACLAWFISLVVDAGNSAVPIPEKTAAESGQIATSNLIQELQQSILSLQQLEIDFRSTTNLAKTLEEIHANRQEAAVRIRKLEHGDAVQAESSRYVSENFAKLYSDTEYVRFIMIQNLSKSRRIVRQLRTMDEAVAAEYESLLKSIAANLFHLSIDLSIPSAVPNLLVAKGFLFGSTPQTAEASFRKTIASF